MRTSTLVTLNYNYTQPMDTPRKIAYGHGAGHLGSDPPVLAPSPLAADPVYDDDADQINAVPVKLPELWQSKVRSWFAQAKAQFATSGISSSLTKYYQVIKALLESSIERIPELLPPAADPYSVLKNWLMELYDLSDYQKAELLMTLPQVDGDMRPSLLLDKMRFLTPTGELENPTSLFWYAFLSRLPPDIRVSCVPFVGMETLADVARHADAQWCRGRASCLRQGLVVLLSHRSSATTTQPSATAL